MAPQALPPRRRARPGAFWILEILQIRYAALNGIDRIAAGPSARKSKPNLRSLMSPSGPCSHLNKKSFLSAGPQDTMAEQTQTAPFIDGLYGKLVEGGVGYFFPSAQFDLLEPDPDPGEHRIEQTSVGTSLILNWLGSRYSLTRDEAFSESELKLLTSIGAVLDSRYRMIVDAPVSSSDSNFFEGCRRIDTFPPISMALRTHRRCGKDRIEWRTRSRSFARVRSAPTKTGVSRLVCYFSGKTQILATTCRSRLRRPALLSSLDLNPDFLPAL